MNPWHWTALVYLLCLISCGYVCFFRRDPEDRLVGMQTASTFQAFLFAILAIADDHLYLFDLALTIAVLQLGSCLVFVRYMERWR